MPEPVKFSSQTGQAAIRDILRKILPHDVHDWNVIGTGHSLDGRDLLVRSATGSGKTGFYLYYLLILISLSRDPIGASAYSIQVPKNPAIIVIFPTNGLEEEMETKFRDMGVPSVAINSHTLQAAHQEGRNLWELAEKDANAVFLSPEQLISQGFERLIHSKIFQGRVCALGVDEVHLVCSWGMGFRKAFQQIGFVRARMSANRPIAVIATTATLRKGAPFDTICATLGLVKHQFYDLHLSNHRPEVQILFRTLQRGLGGWQFPDLAWILTSGRRTIIFCRTIALGFRVTMYLRRLAPSTPSESRDVRIRMYNSLNWPSYNLQTRELFRNHPDSQIIVATTSFMVGLDFPHVCDAVLLSAPPDPDEKLQWGGRVARNKLLVPNGRCITYLTRKAKETAQAVLSGKVVSKGRGGAKGGKKSTKKAAEMDSDMAALILAPCKIKKLNEIYDNPVNTAACLCQTCSTQPVPPTTHDLCNCSGCMIEDLPPLTVTAPPKRHNPVPQKERLRKTMRVVGTSRLIEFRWTVYNKTDTAASRLLPPTAFFPDSAIKSILDRFALLQTPQDTLSVLDPLTRTFVEDYADDLWDILQALRPRFEQMRIEHDNAQKVKRQSKKKETAQRGDEPSVDSKPQVTNSSPAALEEVRATSNVPNVPTTMLHTFKVAAQPPTSPRGQTVTAVSTTTTSARRKRTAVDQLSPARSPKSPKKSKRTMEKEN